MSSIIARTLGTALKGVHAGDAHLAWADPRLAEASLSALTLTSPAFAPGGFMPPRYAGPGVGQNVSPPLAWTGAPEGTAEFVLVVQDPDAPLPRPVVHCLTLRIPGAFEALAEGAMTPGVDHRLAFGRGTFGVVGWSGPKPVPGHGPHRYVFQLFALSAAPSLPAGASLKTVRDAMAGLVVGRSKLIGRYEVA